MFADKIKIPLRVGIGEEFLWSSLLPYLYLAILFLLAYGIVQFFINRYNKSENPQED
jgi:hypothetical protein